MNAEILTVTPEMAEDWLRSNHKNRGLTRKYVRRYARMMKDNDWLVTADAIGFDKNGRLLNGQHRLNAVIESGIPQQFVVVTGLDTDSFDRHDTGRPRNSSQILSIEGYPNTTRMAAAIRLLMGFEDDKDSPGARSNVQPMSSLSYAKMHGDKLVDSVRLGNKAYREGPKLARPSILGFLHYAMRHRDSQKAWDFIYGVSTGMGIESTDDPRYAMRERLIRESSSVSTLDRTLEVALMTKAANKFFAGESAKRITWSKGQGEDFPRPDVGPNYPFGFFD